MVLKRLGWALFTILFVVILNFFFSGYCQEILQDKGFVIRALLLKLYKAIRVRFGLDKPVIKLF